MKLITTTTTTTLRSNLWVQAGAGGTHGITILLKPPSLTYNKRWMFKIGRIPPIIKEDVNSIARAALGVLHTITDETVIVGLSNNLPKALIKQSFSYLDDNTDMTNLQLKGNFLSSIIKNNNLNAKDVSEAYQETFKNTKLAIVNNGKMSVRSLMEVIVAKNFMQVHSKTFKYGLITGDNLMTNNKTQSNEDFYQELNSSFGIKKVSVDIKLGNNMAKRAMSGTLGQLHYDGDRQISTPNNPINLVEFNTECKKEIVYLLNALHHKNISMSQEQYDMLQCYLKTLKPLLETLEVDSILTKHIEIERVLIKIHSLPELPRRPGFINIVKLSPSRELTSNEDRFIKEILPYIDENIFKSQKSFNNFIRKVVTVYQRTVDQQTVQKLRVIKNTAWEYSFLDNIDVNIFNS